ncbi:hypothetical protein, partial [Tritonibacter litoralis]|uniref:hypothetical protein n=1 Tax=Tritonibacter litoralis TaxID=2662264 RepID=UPI001BE43ED0
SGVSRSVPAAPRSASAPPVKGLLRVTQNTRNPKITKITIFLKYKTISMGYAPINSPTKRKPNPKPQTQNPKNQTQNNQTQHKIK